MDNTGGWGEGRGEREGERGKEREGRGEREGRDSRDFQGYSCIKSNSRQLLAPFIGSSLYTDTHLSHRRKLELGDVLCAGIK